MTTLDKIIQDLYEYSFMTGVHNEHGTGMIMKDQVTVKKAKVAIKQHYLELIGEDEPRPAGNGNSAIVRRVVSRNKLREELRKKIENE